MLWVMKQGEITLKYEAEVDDNVEAVYRQGDVSTLTNPQLRATNTTSKPFMTSSKCAPFLRHFVCISFRSKHRTL